MSEVTKPNTAVTPTAPTQKGLTIVDYAQQDIDKLIKENAVVLPEDYSIGNAIQAAYLKLLTVQDTSKNPVLKSCNPHSITNAIRSMLIQGLTVDKNQGYFIAYADQLQFQRSYFGTLAVAKRFANVIDVEAQVIVEGDEVVVEVINGEMRVTNHKLKNFFDRTVTKENIKGAYCIVKLRNGEQRWEVMNKEQIMAAWKKSKNTAQTVHNEFPDQMAKRTVINRALKLIINSSSDSPLLVKSFNESGYVADDEDDQAPVTTIPETAFTQTISPSIVKDEPKVEETEDPFKV